MSTLAEVILRDTRANQPAAGSTPAGTIYYVTDESVTERCNGSSWDDISDAGSAGMSNPMTTAGDIIVGGSSGTPGRLAIGASGTVPESNGSALAYAYPPGYELAFVEYTSPVNITATTAAGADSIVSAGAVTFDGSRVRIDFGLPGFQPASVALAYMQAELFDGSSDIGHVAIYRNSNYAGAHFNSIYGSTFITPSAGSHTYSIRGFVNTGTGVITAGAGGSGNWRSGYIRIVTT